MYHRWKIMKKNATCGSSIAGCALGQWSKENSRRVMLKHGGLYRDLHGLSNSLSCILNVQNILRMSLLYVGTKHMLHQLFFYFFWPTHYVSMNTVLNLSKNCNYLIPPTQSYCWRNTVYGWSLIRWKKMWNVFLRLFHPFPFKIFFSEKNNSVYLSHLQILYPFQGQ